MSKEGTAAKVNWKASWIWIDTPPLTPNVYVEARRVFRVKAPVEAAQLHISANQAYWLYVNGVFAGYGPSPADNGWKYFDTYDVRELLRVGGNVIAVVAYNFGTEDIVTKQMQGPGGLIAQLEWNDPSGTRRIATDGSWKARRSERWAAQVSRQHQWNGYREIYAAEREDGWEQPDYDDRSWQNAEIAARLTDPELLWKRLLPREIPFLRKEKVKPLSIVRTDLNYGAIDGEERALASSGDAKPWTADASVPGSIPGVVFDFGIETVGYPEFVLQAPQGGVMQLWYGESLDMQLYDTFLLRKGDNRLRPFGRRAFRYLYVTFQAAPAPVQVDSFEVERVGYPFAEEGSFACSDSLLERIWRTGVDTTRINSQDHLEDCPLRERALWVADAVVMAKVIYHVWGDWRLLRKCLLQGARIQNEDGSIPGTGPERNPFVLPDFCAHWLYGVSDYWRFSGDRAFLEEVWPGVEWLMDWFAAQEDDSGLFAGADREGWWCFIDWADYIDRRDRVTAMSCFYYKALHTAADLAVAAGLPGTAAAWSQRAARLRRTIRSQLRAPGGSRVFADCLGPDGVLSDKITAQSNFAAIWCGLYEPEEANRFVSDWYEAGRLPELKGAFFYHIVLESLFMLGRAPLALDKIRTYWGSMLQRGATTWWETFDPSTPDCTIPSPYQGNTPTYLIDHIPVSACHGWGASPTYLLTQCVLGIDVSHLGEGRVRFEPVPGDLTWARGFVPTKYGRIEAEWHRQDHGAELSMRIKVPKGLTAAVPEGAELIWTEPVM